MNKIKKGDNVKILLGKDRDKNGTVERVLIKTGRVVVTGVNVFKRHVKGKEGIEGGIIDIVRSINISNVALVCPNCKKATRVGIKKEGNENVRVCKKCKKEIK